MCDLYLLRERLTALGFCSWYTSKAAHAYSTDPWLAFSLATDDLETERNPLHVVRDLFVYHETVSRDDVVETFGRPLADEMVAIGLLKECGHSRYTSEFCLIVAFGELLLADWPVKTPLHRLACNRTYLGASSYDCARFVGQAPKLNRALDLGCGGGLLAIKLARHASSVVAVDIDERACRLADLNGRIAGVDISVLRSDWNSLPADLETFDLIVANPPWRIVPPELKYPDAAARVGAGAGGLGQVADLLRLVPRLLSGGGRAVIRFDLPLDRHDRCPFDFNPAALLPPDFACHFESLGRASVEDQVVLSADTCAHKNPGVADLPSVFRDYYSSLGVEALWRVLCVVEKSQLGS